MPFEKLRRSLAPMAEGDPTSVPGGVGPDGQKPTPTAPAVPQATTNGDPFRAIAEAVGWRNPEEIKASLKAQREQAKLLEQALPVLEKLSKLQQRLEGPQEPAPATKKPEESTDSKALSEVRELRRELELERAFTNHGITDAKQRRLLLAAVKAENPQDIGAFIAEFAPAKSPSPVAPVAAASNTGAPSSPAQTAISDDPFNIPAEVLRNMTPEQVREHYQKRARVRLRGNDNPFARKPAPK